MSVIKRSKLLIVVVCLPVMILNVNLLGFAAYYANT